MTSILTLVIVALIALMALGMFKPAVVLPKFLANKSLPNFLQTRLQTATDNPTRGQVLKVYPIAILVLCLFVGIFGKSSSTYNSSRDDAESSSDTSAKAQAYRLRAQLSSKLTDAKDNPDPACGAMIGRIGEKYAYGKEFQSATENEKLGQTNLTAAIYSNIIDNINIDLGWIKQYCSK